ncbi:MAG: hypothetical protein KJ023_06210 [Burkholderiaceae bacterium]|nr:hypothetical protein [Burkholderiaceae bacterium]
MSHEAAREGGFLLFGGAPLVLLDSIAAVTADARGAVVVSGSHGGTSAARYAIAARPLLTVFNDAGVGKDEAGIVGLAMLQAEGLAAAAVAHTSARIGEAASTLDDGVIAHGNDAAAAKGARAGLRIAHWLQAARTPAALNAPATESSPARR